MYMYISSSYSLVYYSLFLLMHIYIICVCVCVCVYNVMTEKGNSRNEI